VACGQALFAFALPQGRIRTDAMALAPGTKVGPDEVKALIGSGGMGEVYRPTTRA
jgi:hypothetical protein